MLQNRDRKGAGLTDSQFVDALQRRAADPANDGGAIAAHQRIGYRRVTAGTIKFHSRSSNFLGHY
jgi:hypothetical protein